MKLWFRVAAEKALVASASCLLMTSCVEGITEGPQEQVSPAESPTFFAATLEHFATDAQMPVVVEPRPLRPESMLYSIRDNDLLADDDATVRLRTRVIGSLGLHTSDATEDWKCVFSQGLRNPRPGMNPREDSLWAARMAQEPDSLRQRRDACLARGNRLSLAFGLPQAQTDPAHPGRWRIRAVRMLLYGWEVVDLFLEARPGGGWEVVAEQTRVGAFS